MQMRVVVRLLSLTIILHMAVQSSAQSMVKTILSSGRVLAWRNFLRQSNITYNSAVSREIITGYFEECINITENFSGGRVFRHRVSLLFKENNIIYWMTDKAVDEIRPIDCDSFTNQVEFRIFEDAFKSTYHRQLCKKDLFEGTVFSYDFCYLPERMVGEMEQLEIVMQRRDTTVPERWLRSANVEKQLYAILAFSNYRSSGMTIKSETLNLIRYVGMKKGTYLTCGGCRRYSDTISKAAIKFNNMFRN